MSAAERMRALRARRRAEAEGLFDFTIRQNRERLGLALGEDGFLKDWDDVDDQAITRALSDMLKVYIATMIGEE